MLVLDTDVLIDVEKKDTAIMTALTKLKTKHPEGISITSSVYAEFMFGIISLAKEKREKSAESLNTYPVLEFDKYAAAMFAELKWNLEKQGSPIPLFDLLNASIALRHGATVVTRDHHYKAVPGLKIVLV